MAEFPLEPPMSKMLIAAVDLGCSDEILTIVACLSAQNIWFRPREKQASGGSEKGEILPARGRPPVLAHRLRELEGSEVLVAVVL